MKHKWTMFTHYYSLLLIISRYFTLFHFSLLSEQTAAFCLFPDTAVHVLPTPSGMTSSSPVWRQKTTPLYPAKSSECVYKVNVLYQTQQLERSDGAVGGRGTAGGGCFYCSAFNIISLFYLKTCLFLSRAPRVCAVYKGKGAKLGAARRGTHTPTHTHTPWK